MLPTPLLAELVKALQCLPGIGPKSAQRIAFNLLERNRDGARRLAQVLEQAMDDIGQCESCRTFAENTRCQICNSSNRDRSVLCVVENPMDVASIEQSTDFDGVYFVLMGRLSPIDGVTPERLGLPLLERRLAEGGVKELIVATGTTMEGEATAHYLKQIAQRANVTATRIAYGVPVGGELEYVDGSTLSHAIASRREY
ncbi:MAG: recombination protein RecR [Gammaproteobacteria bacterium]|nr:recombination protein RecR [Gammaproteobacteria bacterium]